MVGTVTLATGFRIRVYDFSSDNTGDYPYLRLHRKLKMLTSPTGGPKS